MRRRWLEISLPWAVGLALSAVSNPAMAGDAAAAEVLFRDGKRLMDEGKFDAACPKLAESYRMDPATGALLALGLCYERAGLWASAWSTYTDAVARARSEGRADREEAAGRKVMELEPKLSKLVIELDAETQALGATVSRDGQPVGAGALGTPLPVDPGKHVVEVSAPGKQPFRTELEVSSEGRQTVVKVPKLVDAAPSVAGPSAPKTPPPSATEAEGTWTPLRIGGAAAVGVGVVGLAVGSVFALRASGLDSDSQADCDAQDFCGKKGKALRDDAIASADVATVAFIAGGVLAAGGVALWFVGAPNETGERAGVWLAPQANGVALGGRFR